VTVLTCRRVRRSISSYIRLASLHDMSAVCRLRSSTCLTCLIDLCIDLCVRNGPKHIHEHGLLHCDIRPKQFLIDEYGILKFADFKFTRRIAKAPLGNESLQSRGTAPYMSPELFEANGVHSYFSDFWALGCLLYELRRGLPPFGDASSPLADLLERIRTVEPVGSPIIYSSPQDKRGGHNLPAISAELADLLMWMLEKSPGDRCNW